MSDFRMSGGCQCGAVRYALLAVADTPCICHCRMCQKQTGNYFGAFAGIEEKHFEVTRGEVAYFRSSDIGDRGFCRDCGTPLVYRYTSVARVAVTLGSLDDPSRLKPIVQYGVESRMPWFSELAKLPATKLMILRLVRASAEVTASTRITILLPGHHKNSSSRQSRIRPLASFQ